MIDRYSLPEMAALFTDKHRFELWLQIELLAVDGMSSIGMLSLDEAKTIRRKAPEITTQFVNEVKERENITHHDMAAFVDVVQQAIGYPLASWIHKGLTSSDIVDTALCFTLRQATHLLIQSATELIHVLKARTAEFIATPMIGRTHGMYAEPITFGTKLALWCLSVDRDRERLRRAGDNIAVGKLSGAVGTYSCIDPRVEAFVCNALGLVPTPATQVIARDRHAEYLWACASLGATIETFATEIRHLQRSEVSEVAEPFSSGQKGSSAMPHKRNPVVAERLCGLSRLLRGYLSAGLENVALWHERDISHSSVERIALEDASLLGYYLLKKMIWLIEGMDVYPDKMAANLESAGGVIFSQPILLWLMDHNMTRDEAYRIVQRDAGRSLQENRSFAEIVEQDPQVDISVEEIKRIFSFDKAILNAERLRKIVDKID
ncbi:MAG: adenylosuccinate lyase [Actinobacteria bacterium]|nr:adenylosuccinate lyase [Actinomycetota bacterium]MCL6104026.1 adenylosuccinate lyase [Actinomycetota bacterium]